jgi:Fe-S cluster assembly scaffold protein SufB
MSIQILHLREYPDLVKKYFGTVIPYTDNKYAALNSAVWSGGSFIYVPKGVKVYLNHYSHILELILIKWVNLNVR